MESRVLSLRFTLILLFSSSAPTSEREIPEYFRLDPELMKYLDSIDASVPKIQLQEFDLNFLQEEVVIPSIDDARARY